MILFGKAFPNCALIVKIILGVIGLVCVGFATNVRSYIRTNTSTSSKEGQVSTLTLDNWPFGSKLSTSSVIQESTTLSTSSTDLGCTKLT